MLTLSDWEFPHRRQDIFLLVLSGQRPVRQLGVHAKIGSNGGEGASPRIVSEQSQVMREPLLHFRLQPVVKSGKSVRIALEGLRPSKLLVVRFALIQRQSAITDDGGRIAVIVSTIVPSAVAHIRHLGHKAAGDRKSTRLNSSHLGISYAVFC